MLANIVDILATTGDIWTTKLCTCLVSTTSYPIVAWYWVSKVKVTAYRSLNLKSGIS